MTIHIADPNNFLDVNGLNDIRLQSKSINKADKKAALEKVAKQFESLFMQMLLKSMRQAQAVLESDSPFNSKSVKFYRDMHDQQLAVELSKNGSLGLAPLIVRQLGGDRENFTPHSVLRNNGRFNAVKSIPVKKEQPKFSFIAPDHLNNVNKGVDVTPYKFAKAQDQTLSFTPMSKTATSKTSLLNTSTLKTSLTTEKTSKVGYPVFNHPKDFVTAISAPAKRAEKELGVPYQVIIAQAALETGWGQKIIKTAQGASSNNLFNIKAGNNWQGDKTQQETLEYKQGTVVKTKAPFRVYSSINDSVNDFIHFLSSNDRYQDALNKSGNVEQFLHGLQKAGYATDPNYASKILSTLGSVSNLLNQ